MRLSSCDFARTDTLLIATHTVPCLQPKRPPSAYLLFQSKMRKDAGDEKVSSESITNAWKALTEEQKKVRATAPGRPAGQSVSPAAAVVPAPFWTFPTPPAVSPFSW